MVLARESLPYDGQVAKAYKSAKERSGFSGKYNAENYIQGGWGDAFDYSRLNKDLRKLVDWFFDADLPVDLEHEGLTADEVSKKLVDEHLPQGFDLEKLKSWILGVKGKVKENKGVMENKVSTS